MQYAALEQENLSFAELKRSETLWGPHGYHRYPAKFIPQLVRRIIECYSTPHDIVGDVFLGSGTTGVEALRTNRRFYGSDINQIAGLISQAKCIPLEPLAINSTWQGLQQQVAVIPKIGRRKLTESEIQFIHSINIAQATKDERFEYWFPKTYREVLRAILEHILQTQEERERIFILCAFSNILKRCSIWLSGSTKPQKDLTRVLGDPVEEFNKQMRDMLRRNELYWNDLASSGIKPGGLADNCEIRPADARHLPLPNNTLDLSVTSPPYATCYEYSEIHQLTHLWFEQYGIVTQESSRSGWIGSKTVTGRTDDTSTTDSHTGSTIADAVVDQLHGLAKSLKNPDIVRGARSLQYYFHDMALALSEIARVTKVGKRTVLVIGDSSKWGICVPTTDALLELALASRFVLEKRLVRQVPGRVLVSTRDKKTGRFSSTATSDTQAYPEENILVLIRSH